MAAAMRVPGNRTKAGMTFVDLLIGSSVLVVTLLALMGVFLGQVTMNEHARNLALATNDVNRVMEQVRRQNTGAGCLSPSVLPPAGFAAWDAWLADTSAVGGGGKSLSLNPGVNELVVVSSVGTDPLAVTVAVCWRQRGRTIGECAWNGAVLSAAPGLGGNLNVTESPAMLSTALTCRR